MEGFEVYFLNAFASLPSVLPSVYI